MPSGLRKKARISENRRDQNDLDDAHHGDDGGDRLSQGPSTQTLSHRWLCLREQWCRTYL
jgi:hypothetical protein